MTPEYRKAFCRKLLSHRRIRGCIVILCEGDIGYLDIHTPQQMRKLENFPDANFWRATVPRWWRNKKPVFIPCGDRVSVLRTYQELKELHEEIKPDSYLSSEKLFALVDLDLQPGDLTGISSQYGDTEELRHQMYDNSQVNREVISDSHVLVTGWIHKEAYFLEPDLQSLFDTSDCQLRFSGSSLQLDDIYREMSQDIRDDVDIGNHFSTVWERIKSHFGGTPGNPAQLAQLWKEAFATVTDDADKRKLVECILTVKKAKPYWHKIRITHAYQDSDEDALRDSLLLDIAEFYAGQCRKTESLSVHAPYHIPQWIRILWEFP